MLKLCWICNGSRCSCEAFNLPPPQSPGNRLSWFDFVCNNVELFRKYIKQSESTDVVPLVLKKPCELAECPCCQKLMLAYKADGHLSKAHKRRHPEPFVAGFACRFRHVDFSAEWK